MRVCVCVCVCEHVWYVCVCVACVYVRTYLCERLCEDLPPPFYQVSHVLQKVIIPLLLTSLHNTKISDVNTSVPTDTRGHRERCEMSQRYLYKVTSHTNVCKQCIPQIAPSC